MSLSSSDRKEIEEIVRIVIKQEFSIISKEIIMGFVESIDWYTENLGKIIEQLNAKQESWASGFREKLDRIIEEPKHKKVGGFGK